MSGFFLEVFFLTVVVALNAYIVLVELVLCKEVVPYSFVESLDFSLLCLHVLVLSSNDLEALYELELETGMFVYS